MFLRQNRLGKLIVCLMLTVILGFGSFMTPGTAGAEEISITVTGDGVTTPTTFTEAQLNVMEQVYGVYSTINTWPTKKWYVAEGVRLADLLTAAGIRDEAKTLKITAKDGLSLTFTRQDLLGNSRYYYPGLKENHEYFGQIPGSTENAVLRDTVIALKSASATDDPDYMNTQDAPLLVFGQRYVTEQTNHAFIKYVNKIEVFTDNPDKWDEPTATPAGGTVEAGTMVQLNNINMDADKVYYTTDGTEPTVESPMYNWIAKRWWSSRSDDLATINHPIEITEDTVIKAKTIGLGKEDSNTVTFTYQIPTSPITLIADSSNNLVGQAIELTFSDDETWRNAITDITVNDNSISGNYTVAEGKITINASVFTAAGDYTVKVKATEYPDTQVTQTIREVSSNPDDFTIQNGVLTGYVGAGGEVIIPGDLGITSIGQQAFANCSTITSISIPGGVTSIGDSAFQTCGSLTSISIPEGVTSIGLGVFWGCSNLTLVNLPSTVASLGDNVFYQCSGLSSVNIPEGVTSIGESAFRDCSSLTSITIPDNLASIGNNAFYGCSSLSSINLPDNITSIGESAFCDCSSLSSVTIPGNVTTVGKNTFRGCSSLTSITFPDSVTSLGDYTFRDCSSLISITIPDSVTSIGKYTFQNCSSLLSISLPDSVNSLGDHVFRDCSSLTQINVGSNNPNYASDGGVLFNKDVTILVCCPPGKTGEYIIPNSVESIQKNAFFNCVNLTSITIPNSITIIGEHAFDGCSSLTSITIPDSVTSIGSYAFRKCSSLTSIIIPASVTSIGSSAFRDCSNLTIYVYEGSAAKTYATDNSIPFEVITGTLAPTLTADTSNNKVGQAIDITFADDADWRDVISEITVDETALDSSKYSVAEGTITIDQSVFAAAKDYAIVVKATGYMDATVNQTIAEPSVTTDVLFDGTVTLTPDETFSVTAYNSSTAYTVNKTTPLGALQAAAADSGFTYAVTDKNYSSSGALLLDNVGTYTRKNPGYWYAYVNDVYKDGYNNAPDALNLMELANGDKVEFYYAADIEDGNDLNAMKAAATAAVKTVVSIEAAAGDWTLQLSGASERSVSKAYFENGLACSSSGHQVFWTDDDDNVWGGVPLWLFAAMVDDNPDTGSYHFNFNDELASNGYEVKVIAGDDWSTTFASADIARNNGYIVANTLNGEPLPLQTGSGKDCWPLHLKGSAVTSGKQVGNIVKIELLGLPDQPEQPIPELHVIKYGEDNTTVIDEKTVDYQWMQSELDVIGDGTTVFKYEGITNNPNDLWDEAETYPGGYKISNAVKGTRLKDLCELVGGMGAGTELVLVAKDGYETRLPYSSIYTDPSVQARQGDAVLAWWADDKYVPDYTDGMRLFFMPEDTIYGQWDMHETLPENYWHYYYSSGDEIMYPSCAGLSGKYITELRVYSIPQGDWTLELDGSGIGGIDYNVSKTYFESALACQFGANHKATYTDSQNRVWEGMPLWFLAGFVDDADQHTDNAFNDELAAAGYQVVITADDGYSITIDSADIIRNNNYIVANTLNGALIPETDNNWPLRLVGPDVTGGTSISQIVSIELVPVQAETPQYDITPVADAIYTIGATDDGINTMTVNSAQTGFKYFAVSIEPVKANEGTETVVFTHLRDNIQLGLNAVVTDFDVADTAKAGFNVEPGDVVKVYIVDQITNDIDCNPIVFQ